MRIFLIASAILAIVVVQGCDGDATSPPAAIGPGRFTQVSAGGGHACALDTLRRAWCWGSNGMGAVGVALKQCAEATGSAYPGCITSPTLVSTTLQFKEISAGRNHTCAITDAGAAYCWGSNTRGQIGASLSELACFGAPCSATPIAVPGGFTFKSIAAGDSTTCGVTTANVGKCWGKLLGPISGGATPDQSVAPVTVRIGGFGDSIWVSIARPSGVHACGITSSDRPLCWGDGSKGQMGSADTPTLGSQPPAPTISSAAAMSVVVTGSTFSCGLDAEGAAFCWGAAYRDGLGLNEGFTGVSCGTNQQPYTCYYVPTRVQGSRRFVTLTAGIAHVCGISKNPTESRCWGNDVDYAIGQGVSPFIVATPYPTLGEHPFSSVSSGDQFSCGVTTDANVWCWGSNRAGQLGIHPTVGRLIPLLYSAAPSAVGVTTSIIP